MYINAVGFLYEAQEQEKSELKDNFTDTLNLVGGKLISILNTLFYLQENTGLCSLPPEEFPALLTT